MQREGVRSPTHVYVRVFVPWKPGSILGFVTTVPM